MASRNRRSTTSPSGRRRPLTAVKFPPYEPLTYPLNNAAQGSLNDLYCDHSLAKLKNHYADANKAITSTAGIINNYLYKQEEDYKGAEKLKQLRQKVNRIT